MSTPGRIVAILVVAAVILAVAVLEVVSERVRVEPAFPPASPAYLADSETWNGSGSTVTEPREVESIIVLRSGRPVDTDPEP